MEKALGEDLFADEAVVPARKLATYLGVYALRFFKYGLIFRYPDPFVRNKIGEAAVLEMYRQNDCFNHYLEKYGSFLSLESHVDFVKEAILNIYRDVETNSTCHPFVRICAFTVKMFIYIHERHLPMIFHEYTVLPLAWFLSSRVFDDKTNFRQLRTYCRLLVESMSEKDIAGINQMIWNNPERKETDCGFLHIF